MGKKLTLAQRIAKWVRKAEPEVSKQDTPHELLETLRHKPHDLVKIISAGNCWLVATKVNEYGNCYGDWDFVISGDGIAVFDGNRRKYVEEHCLFKTYEAAEAKHKVFLAHAIKTLKARVAYVDRSRAVSKAIAKLNKK